MPSGSVLHEVLTWSEGRPAWQRDALRRLVVKGSLEPGDLGELTAICLDAHGAGDGSAPPAAPLSEAHLPSGPEDVDAVSLCAIADVQNVNALAPGQTLPFLPKGLTVLYGDNASGKSGYVRILRSCCRARARDVDVLPNVCAPSPAGEPSATIRYQVGQADRSTQWKAGQASPDELAAIAVFDSDCASLYVNEQSELAFRPLGLDVFDKLASACVRMKTSLQELLEQVGSRRPTSLSSPPVQESSEVGQLLATLSEATSPERVRELARLSEEEAERLAHLKTTLEAEPAREAARLRGLSRRMERLNDNVAAIETALSDVALEDLRRLQVDALTKRQAADVAAREAFSREPLPDVGSETWRALWEAARRYSEECAFPGTDFPVVGNGARCVLCQQKLDSDAADRLVRFEEFVRAQAEKAATDAEAAFRQRRLGIEEGTTPGEDVEELTEELRTLDEALAETCAAFLRSATARASRERQACEDSGWDDIPPLATSPAAELESLLAQLEKDASELEAAGSDEVRAALQSEYHELADRRWLCDTLQDVLTEIDRLNQEAILREALAETDTTGITRKSTELAEDVVTGELCEAFRKEISALSAPPIRVHVDTVGGIRGVLYHRVRLTDAPDVPVGKVASEGEHGCIALATFLAELATAPSASGIVLDDPVCSLDHLRRRRVAERLVKEAANRQVIVFTHDIVFLSYLRTSATKHNVDCKVLSVATVPGSGPGVCDAHMPWEGSPVSKRLGPLKQMVRQARNLHRQGKIDEYAAAVRGLSTHLRQTWERAVEEVLLNGVVERFEPEVHTKQLGRVTDIRESDCERVDAGMSECSRLMHDQPGAANEALPEPEELHQAFLDLFEWVEDIRRRR